MRSVFVPHLELLPGEQRSLWPGLRPFLAQGFVLYGGTAVSLRLGHRTSVDFDFFTDLHLDKSAVTTVLTGLGTVLTILDRPNTLGASLQPGEGRPVHLSFFGGIGFGRVGVPDLTNDGVLQVASLLDLMAVQLKVITERAEAKDYKDVAAMVGSGVSLSTGLAGARSLYGLNFQPSESLRALSYFEDGDLPSLAQAEKLALVRAAAAVRDLPEIPVISRGLAGSL